MHLAASSRFDGRTDARCEILSAMTVETSAFSERKSMSSIQLTTGPVDSSGAAAAHANRAAWQRRYVRWLRRSDTAVIVVAVFLAQRLRFGEHGDKLIYWNINYTLVSIALVVAWLSAMAIANTRSPQIIGAGAEEYRRVWTATLSVFGAAAIASMVFTLQIARGYMAIALPVGLGCLLLGRSVARKMVKRQRARGEFLTSVLVAGAAGTVGPVIQSLARNAADGYNVVGVCILGQAVQPSLQVPGVGEVPVLGDAEDIFGAVKAAKADTVALTATEHLGPHGLGDLSWKLEELDVDLIVSPGVIDIAAPRVSMRPVSGLPLIHLEKPKYRGAKRFEKRAFDFCFSLLVLVCAAPLLIISAFAIKLSGRGPVFYVSERIGLDGKPFQMLKLRTMVADADQLLDELLNLNQSEGGVLFKVHRDPRVTPVGRILRRYSLDELPQFINVLRGQMSVVGPRPPLAREISSYDDRVRRRLLVLPGITGLWQVSGRSDLSWEDSVRLDLSYVENWSMIGDLLIVVKTLKAVLRGSGAY
jgi:exopolysaccharide biosynthesis polyprenyl glycosylphosphotransferase